MSRIKEQIKFIWSKQTDETISYIIVVILVFFFQQLQINLLGWIAAGFLIYGFFCYLRPSLQIIWNFPLTKIVISALFFVGSTFSMSLAQMEVNSALQVTASPFIYTQAILSICYENNALNDT